MVLGYLGILLEVLEGYAVSVASGVSVVLKIRLLELILLVLCFPHAGILLLVHLLILEGPLLLVLEGLPKFQSGLVYGSYTSTVQA